MGNNRLRDPPGQLLVRAPIGYFDDIYVSTRLRNGDVMAFANSHRSRRLDAETDFRELARCRTEYKAESTERDPIPGCKVRTPLSATHLYQGISPPGYSDQAIVAVLCRVTHKNVLEQDAPAT